MVKLYPQSWKNETLLNGKTNPPSQPSLRNSPHFATPALFRYLSPQIIAFSRLRDSRVRWIEKARTRKYNGSKSPPFFLFRAPPTFRLYSTFARLLHYLRAWNMLPKSRTGWSRAKTKMRHFWSIFVQDCRLLKSLGGPRWNVRGLFSCFFQQDFFYVQVSDPSKFDKAIWNQALLWNLTDLNWLTIRALSSLRSLRN